ncbi:MAG: lipid-A-disaccharide synthase [Kiritimatiellae bacterium]|nr:lipid-A-disaccharide synthase [Kiritimatiellia bacterium]
MKILLLAGEESGVLYAERLRRALPGCEFQTYQDRYKTSDLAVMGFWAVIKRLFFFLGVQRTMKRVIREWRPDVVVTIDYPGLNLKLAAYAKARGIPAVHIVCPQVWAWHQGRIPKVAAAVNRLLCFFPFEPALFKEFEGKDFHATFIGHPMVDVFAEEERRHTNLDSHPEGACLAILPGSRVGEIQRHLPRLLDAVRLLNRQDLRVVIPAANDRAGAEIRATITVRNDPFEPEVVRGGARDLLRRADCAAVASGTATLEAALARCPTVLVYAVSPLLAWFARRVITGVKHIGLANVIAEKSGVEPPMPELLQEAFTPEAVAAQLSAWLNDAEARARASRALDDVMARLAATSAATPVGGGAAAPAGGALGLAAREILEVVHAH